jgi:geranyl-CoA carboxylase alpha subunit
LQRSLAQPVFAQGGATTAFIAQHEAELLHEVSDSRALAVAAWLLHHSGGAALSPSRLAHSLPVAVHLSLGGTRHRATVTQTSAQQFSVQVSDASHAVTMVSHGTNGVRLIVDHVLQSVPFVRDGQSLWLHWAGRPYQVQDLTREVGVRPGEQGGDGKVRATMNGRVVAVSVAVGDRVQAQQALVTLEAMKMEHVHAAPVAGTVTAVHVASGDQVPASRVVVEIQADVPPAAKEA